MVGNDDEKKKAENVMPLSPFDGTIEEAIITFSAFFFSSFCRIGFWGGKHKVKKKKKLQTFLHIRVKTYGVLGH